MKDFKYDVFSIKGLLERGGWRTTNELSEMSFEDARNTLIVVMDGHSRDNGSYFQSLNNDELIGAAAVTLILRESEVCSVEKLKTLLIDDQRNALIIQIHNRSLTDIPASVLQGESNLALAKRGLELLTNSKIISGIENLNFELDNGKILSEKPSFISQQTLNNPSDVPSEQEITFSEKVSTTSTFNFGLGFTVEAGVSVKGSVGVPAVASVEGEVSIKSSSNIHADMSKAETIEHTYSYKGKVVVPPHKDVKVSAVLTMSELDVPFTADIRTKDGLLKHIKGVWNGTSTYNLIVKQENIG